MRKRTLGSTGIEVSEAAFGGVSIGMPYAGQPMPVESESIRLLHAALDHGINFFDTARMYGTSEQLMGKAFRDRRSQVVINTKCVHFLDSDGRIPPGTHLDKIVNESLEKSLETLQTDYIDIYMLHQSSPDVLTNQELADIFTGLREQGKVRAIGASTYTLEETRMCLEAGIWDVIQLPFNVVDQQQVRCFPEAVNKGVGLVVRSALFRGMLTGKSLSLHPELRVVESHINQIRQLTGGEIPDLVTLAMKFVLSYRAVSSMLIGMDRMEHLTKAIEVVDGNYFDSDQIARLEDLAFPDPGFLHLSHWVRNGWLNN